MKTLKPLIALTIVLLLLAVHSCKKSSKKDGPQPNTIVTEAHIGDSIKVTFPPGSTNATSVSLKQATDKNTQAIFDETSSFVSLDKSLPQQIILNIGNAQPINDSIKITIKLPDYFKASKQAGYGFQLFAQIYQGGTDDVIDAFSMIQSNYDPAAGSINAYLPRELFTNARTADKTFEAILMVGTTPGENLQSNALRTNLKTQDTDPGGCLIAQIACPLGSFDDCTKYKGDIFGKRADPFTGIITVHLGVDFKVAEGTAIYAVASGTVEKQQTSVTYGKIIFLRHSDGTATLYAHLSNPEVTVGQTITKGQEIAKSGKTGSRVTGPHLHFEYYPNGHNYADGSQKDPFACITQGNVDGSITVRDNGNIADDSFELYLDGYLLGTTDIGGINSFAAFNLRPGTKTMTLKCVVAPDDDGTYEVVLNSGITFISGETETSGDLEEGQSISWQITIPNQTNKTNNLNKLRKNTTVERKVQ